MAKNQVFTSQSEYKPFKVVLNKNLNALTDKIKYYKVVFRLRILIFKLKIHQPMH